MTPPTPHTDPDGTDCRYLSLVRGLAAVTQAQCAPNCTSHQQDAAWHINALIGNPELLWQLFVVAGRMEKHPPAGLNALKESFLALQARQASQSDGSTATKFSDGSSPEKKGPTTT